jgi:hypothetical protein
VKRISFQTALLFAPLAYALHHIEEHVLFNFRAWRLRHFADNNQLSTEAVFCILTAITLVYLILHAVTRSRASAQAAILFLMATQLQNAIYHVGGTLYWRDWSPGTVTAVALYVPVSALVLAKGLEEGWITRVSGLVLFLLGGALFWSFEMLGPPIMLPVLLLTWGWVAYDFFRGRSQGASRGAAQRVSSTSS